MSWLRTIGGRLKSDYRYTIGVVYNTFPLPVILATDKARLNVLAQRILSARVAFPDSSLADLYDRLTMPVELRKAHRALDLAVDKLYRPLPFMDDRERAEHLLKCYEEMTAPLLVLSQQKPKRKRTKN